MPTYEYECSKGHRFEAEQSINDPALKRCRVCRSKVQRLISASAFILKGGGWYSDLYASTGNKGGGASSSSTSSSSSGSASSGSAASSGSSSSGGSSSGGSSSSSGGSSTST